MTNAKKTPENIAAAPEQLRIRRKKRDRLLEAGIRSYLVEVPRTHSLGGVREERDHLEAGEGTQDVVTVIGRAMSIRNTSKLRPAVLQENDGTTLQAILSKVEVDEDALTAWKADMDVGDFVLAINRMISSRRGELFVMATEQQMASRALHPLPALFADLSEDSRTHHRYMDLIMREQVCTSALTRIKVTYELCHALKRRGFLEVETPMLQTLHGDAAARPFVTHSNALDIDLYLRITPELYLKRCVAGGMRRVFEINRNFRNGGIDSSHNPELVVLEYYEVFGTYDDSAHTVREVIQGICVVVFGSTTVTLADGMESDFGGERKRIEMYLSLNEALARKLPGQSGVAIDSTIEKLKAVANVIGLEVPEKGGWGHDKLVEEIWELLCEDQLDGPVFARDSPVETSPLAHQHRSKPGMAEKWDLYARGFELATGYSELVDPVVQRKHFEDQARLAASDDDEAMVLNEDLLHAMEQGTPSVTGVGMDIDRPLIALTGLGTRETVLFPTVRPEA